MRPKSLKQVVGQSHLIGEDKILTQMVNTHTLNSLILYGPPGTGKTSIAHALSHDLGIPFEYINASVHTKKDIQDVLKQADADHPIVCLIDEIHRLDKPKQDLLLMYLESGAVLMVGATTENPYMSIRPAIRSRAHIFELKPVTIDDVVKRLHAALLSPEGLGDIDIDVSTETLEYLAKQTNGDLRQAFNVLELALAITPVDENNYKKLSNQVIDTILQQRQIQGDADGDAHYDLLSAFQKSIRGSDADAALHYLSRLLTIGDLNSIHRRLMVIAYEDIGLADPHLPVQVMQAIECSKQVGMPEARIPLANAVVLACLAPKSNSAYKAVDMASTSIENATDLSIPKHLRDAHYKGANDLGNGVDYAYPHDYPYSVIKQQYLPDALKHDRYLDTPDMPMSERYNALKRATKPDA